MLFDAQVGISAETTWGTWVAPARSLEVMDVKMKGHSTPLVTPGIRAGRFMASDNMVQPIVTDASGSIEFVPYTKGFGLWLQSMFGTVTVGSVISSHYLQTHTPGPQAGISFAMEVYKPFVSATKSGNVFRYAGCKIPSWTLSQSRNEHLRAALSIDAQSEVTSNTLTTAVYPSTVEPFPWTTATVTVGGSAVEVNSWELTCDMQLAADRLKIRGNSLKDEQIENGYRKMGIKLSGVEFETMTHYNRVMAVLEANKQAAIVISLTGLADTTAAITITAPSAVAVSDDGLDLSPGSLLIEQDLMFDLYQPAAGGAGCTLTYNSADSSI